ncbi:MAG: hypothetical protein R6X02_10045 [Enhygromyxa sp.]
MVDGPRRIALVVEAGDDARTAGHLVDRLLGEAADWIADGDPDHYRTWLVIHWKNVKTLCEEHGVVVQGGFGGEPAAPDARAARRALVLLAKLGLPDAAVLLRDADNQPQRLVGLRQGRECSRHLDASRIAVGMATPTREAWHLAGFVPQTADETARLEQQRQRLGLDPACEPQRLQRKGERDIKAVLAELTGDDVQREQACLDSPLEHLRERGAACGLSEFLDEVHERVVPLFV